MRLYLPQVEYFRGRLSQRGRGLLEVHAELLNLSRVALAQRGELARGEALEGFKGVVPGEHKLLEFLSVEGF